MHLAKQNFHTEAFTSFPTYMSDNPWFGFKSDKDDPKGPKRTIAMAWLAYEKTNGATAGTLILGDTKIRSDEELVANFGLSSAGGVQEQESLAMVEALFNTRQVIASNALHASAQVATPVVGSGSILSTRGWSPLLNDSFIMGGVHAGHQFQVALNTEEAATFGRTKNAGLTTKDNWRLFLRANPRTLWDSERGVPRVLMREFFCLEVSGYKANFEKDQLIFGSKKEGSSDKASFLEYLKALSDRQFHKPADSKDKLITEISKFLFDDENALKGAF